MVETHICLSVNRLLNEETYAIPLYQRNFSWTYDEIAQLLNDVADAFQEKRDRDNYYIGTLVVNEENGIFKIIDGQQRTTALNLIALVLKNEFDCDRLEAVRLTFPARRKSNENIQKLFTKKKISEDDENELTRGYRHAKDAIENVLGERQLDTQSFVDYLFNKVIIFRSILPKDLDLNLYFERFNSRGEQLEAHEILKAQMMAKFGKDQEMAQKFARIWDACADFDKPVINAFTKKAKKKHSDAEREKIFPLNWIKGNHYQNSFLLNIDESLSQIEVQSSNKKSLLSSIGNKESTTVKVVSHTNEVEKYRTIINFETFLYFVYYITFGNVSSSDIQLDDKKLLETFENITSVNTSVEDVTLFIRNLLKLKFIFDNLIVRMSQETNNRRQENDWFLQKVYRNDYNNKARGDLFVQYYYDKNSFEKFNDDILMLQSMFAVTFTANRDSRWLYEILQFLFNNIEELNQVGFASQFKDFLEKMAVRYAEERLFTEDRRIKKYGAIPVYAFNFVDYVLWKNREELKKAYDVKFEDFKFAYRRSIEHWFPQHLNSDERVEKIDDKFLHSFGNLCIITDSQNSKFGNLVPSAKYKQWEGIFNRQSLKLQMMADVTVKNDKWGICEIQSMEKEVERYVHDFCDS
ncbi:GmrSD restriction endonuclease domain-containing protein [Streptococcus sp. V728]|uniref:GmrSD restriction endonuclease domain-containing protein n=1 Tax=Streptococcus sp. V728 TaxID=3455700 RepID=UPI003F914947